MDFSKRKSKISINHLPEELILKIFTNLPPKTIHKMKVVCKHWSSLISQPSFPKQYFNNTRLSFSELNPNRTLYFYPFYSDNRIVESLTIDGNQSTINFLPDRIYYLGSSNGLVLSGDCYVKANKYYVCNPLTKQWVTLPEPPSGSQIAHQGITCDPCCDGDSRTRFKVVRIVFSKPLYLLSTKILSMEIFDSETGKWIAKTETLTSSVQFGTYNEAIELKGVLHWPSYSTSVMLALDLNHHTCRLIQLPKDLYKSIDDNYSSFCIGVSQNQLYFVKINSEIDINAPNSTIWKIKNDEKGEWYPESRLTLNLLINYDRNLNFPSCQLKAIDPIDNNVLYLFVYRGSATAFYSVNIKTGEVKTLGDGSLSDCFVAHMFHQRGWPTSVPRITI